MEEERHRHPHVDPRRPRDGARVGTNPPVFVWKPGPRQRTFGLEVARDEGFTDLLIRLEGLKDPLHLPERAFAPGRYFWRWRHGRSISPVFTFEVPAESVRLEVPPAAEWLKSLPGGHPRIHISGRRLESWRKTMREKRPALAAAVLNAARALSGEAHEIREPDFLPDWQRDYKTAYDRWAKIMWDSRRFVKGAETLALGYLLTGDETLGRAAARRMVSVSNWDPHGSSHIDHNDEAHMSVIWHGPAAVDWVWDLFTAAERKRVVRQFRERGRITYEHMHDRGAYGVTRFNSHAGREIIFLAMIALVFHEEIGEAAKWLDWLRPVLCGIWPIWAGDDGAWAEGPSYGLAYVGIMTMFASALKRGAGIDLYRRPFWRNHALWRKHCLPPYAEWMGFGDHSEPWESTWLRTADLVELIARETGAREFDRYIADLRRYAPRFPTPDKRRAPDIDAALAFAPEPPEKAAPARESGKVLKVFPAAGWAAVRTDLEGAADDVAFIFRSSPFGAVSHSHADNNDFIIHVGGRVMAMPSGYYVGYGSAHHAHWVWHTKAHNCITLSDAGQIMRSFDSTGAVENAFEDERIAYMRGNADASYATTAERCRRHVLFIKRARAFLIVDEFIARTGIPAAVQWNIHGFEPFRVDEGERTFLVTRGASSLEGRFLYSANAFFSLSEGWDPPPMDADERPPQYHLKFTPVGILDRLNLGVVLACGAPRRPRVRMTGETAEGRETVRVGDDTVTVFPAAQPGEALARLAVEGAAYEIRDIGVMALV